MVHQLPTHSIEKYPLNTDGMYQHKPKPQSQPTGSNRQVYPQNTFTGGLLLLLEEQLIRDLNKALIELTGELGEVKSTLRQY